MDSTGIPGYTQVTQEVVDSLQGSHFEFRYVISNKRGQSFFHVGFFVTDVVVKLRLRARVI